MTQILSGAASPLPPLSPPCTVVIHDASDYRRDPGGDKGPPSSHVLPVGSLVPEVRPRCGSWEGGCLGRVHDLDQEEAAPREVVEDHDDEGPVEVNGERLGRHILGDLGGGRLLRPLLVELQRGLVDHLWDGQAWALRLGLWPVREWLHATDYYSYCTFYGVGGKGSGDTYLRPLQLGFLSGA